jgi:hypothetical protein
VRRDDDDEGVEGPVVGTVRLDVTLPVSSQAGYLLKFSRKGGWNYVDDKGEVGKLRTARGKQSDPWCTPCKGAVGLGGDGISRGLDDRI